MSERIAEGQQPQPVLASSCEDWAPFNWDPWLTTATSSMEQAMEGSVSDDRDQTAWINWENFVHDVQGQDEAVLQETSVWR